MSLSNYLELELLDHVWGGAAYSAPATLYVSAHSADPGETGANELASTGSYARVAVTNNLTNWPAASNGSKSNGAAITFPTPTGGWVAITHFGVWDAATSGNFLGGGALDTPTAAISSGDTVQFAIGALTVSLASNNTTSWTSYYLANGLLDLVFGGQTFTPATNIYFSLHTASPSITGANEIAGTNYSRPLLANNATNFPAAAAGAKSNDAVVNFPTPGAADWGTATHFGMYDAVSGGNFLAGGALSVSRAIGSGDTLSFPVGAVDVTLN